MREQGLARADYQGTSYFADGRVERTSDRKQNDIYDCPPVAQSAHMRSAKACGTDSTTGLVIIGYTSTTYTNISFQPTVNAGYLNLFPQATGPDYQLAASQVLTNCHDQLLSAASAALAVAYAIQANAGKHSAAIGQAANQIIARNQGTTLGIAASIEFIIAVAASIGVWDLLFLLVGTGVAIGTIWALIACSDATALT